GGTLTSPMDTLTSTQSLEGGLLRSALPVRTQIGFGAATLAIVLITFFSYRASVARTEAARLVTHTLEVTNRLERLQFAIAEGQTGDLARLRTLLADNPAQLERLSTVERLAAERMRSDRGPMIMEELRGVLGEMKDVERRLLDTRTERWETASTVST